MPDRLMPRIYFVARLFVWLSGAMLIASACLVTVDVFARQLFDVSLGGADEISGYAFGIATTLSLSYALFERAHIRIDVLHQNVPPAVRALLDVLSLLFLTGFIAIVTLMAFNLVADSIANGSRSITPLRTPLSLPQVPWLIGWGFCLFSGLTLLLLTIRPLLRRDWPMVSRMIGIKTVDQQIEDERV